MAVNSIRLNRVRSAFKGSLTQIKNSDVQEIKELEVKEGGEKFKREGRS